MPDKQMIGSAPCSIAIITTGHPADDERNYHKIGISLANAGNQVSIIAPAAPGTPTDERVTFYQIDYGNNSQLQKARAIYRLLQAIQPDALICAEVFPIYPSILYKWLGKKDAAVIYDITEWYPENAVKHLPGIKKIPAYIFLYSLMVIGFQFVDGFFYGEDRKAGRAKMWAPQKSFAQIPYYPVLRYFPFTPIAQKPKCLHIAFTGLLSSERGFSVFLESAVQFRRSRPDVALEVTVMGKFLSVEEQNDFSAFTALHGNDFKINILPYLPYPEFGAALAECQLFVDTRPDTFIYRNSLPIKLFDYLAIGRPALYPRLPAIEQAIDFERIGVYIDPADVNSIVEAYAKYTDNPALLEQQTHQARRWSETAYCWERVEPELMAFIRLLRGC